ncbi:hypothetical protein [Nocardiopsis metallicus]|uniref:Subtilisin inhibitor domain-containing protein n=1 Tax=Nocardiopsis metallicus TaxID=179819 RepID=A0A840VYM9_9ACTN|nr:hypothetical protein [Nocardiopsis metallicus]MBB5488922.1 hypothetical protein [Nocardiopsis metallicus]
MSHSHSDRRSRGSLGTALLAGACCAGAVAYAVLVGPSMLPPQDVQTANAASPEVLGSAIEPREESEEESGPVGHLRIHVSDRGLAWVQTLNCTGDLAEDPEPCTVMAEAAEELAGDPTAGDPGSYGNGEPGEASAGELFTEVREGTVCTDKVYGPQEAMIEGVWEGAEIETTLSRKGSCEEARWQRLRAVTEQIA